MRKLAIQNAILATLLGFATWLLFLPLIASIAIWFVTLSIGRILLHRSKESKISQAIEDQFADEEGSDPIENDEHCLDYCDDYLNHGCCTYKSCNICHES